MYYVYLIETLSAARERYVGITSNLNSVSENTTQENRHTPQNSSRGS